MPIRLLLLCHDDDMHAVLPMVADAVGSNDPKYIPLIVKSAAPVKGDSEFREERLKTAVEYVNTPVKYD